MKFSKNVKNQKYALKGYSSMIFLRKIQLILDKIDIESQNFAACWGPEVVIVQKNGAEITYLYTPSLCRVFRDMPQPWTL